MEYKEKELDNVLGGVSYNNGKTSFDNHFQNEGELSENDLDNVYGSAPKEALVDKTLEHSDLYREKQIEELKEIKEELLSEKNVNSNLRK